ncbi:protein-disulfide reductase DsbD [Paucibacter sp. APW11]|uniref:Thiol:disulfide interchange protein DsbD n=1 Tax=Roseateles aquae TaxID=3077235 RepID=A0ABU3PC61_9BURK|nr:protein-disulfide reductase DsbD [Paucibacter sp. APW11]MDT8999870.1 protein-disulfide reductase DsbD [Paucibacter sp. APW11]
MLHSFITRCCLAIVLLLALPGVRADDFLEPEQAFKLAARALDGKTVEVRFAIAPGYYMYREQYKFELAAGELGDVQIPDGKKKFDETFQKQVEIYREGLAVKVAVKQGSAPLELRVTGQGCADKGLCYPPMTRALRVSLTGFGGDGSVALLPAGEGLGSFGNAEAGEGAAMSKAITPLALSKPEASPTAAAEASPPTNSGNRLDDVLQSGRFWLVVGLFFIGGVGLSLTPCVLPMVPILASIIVGGGGQVSRQRGFLLALAYSQGMALVYTALGVAAGLAGEGLAAYFQSPGVLTVFGLALVLFSLSMFGAYELRLPSGIANRLNDASQKLEGGRFAAVFLMGAVSALLVSPCVTGVLASALLYLSKTHDVVLGGSALYALANGMSVPLLLLGLSAGTLLPRAGPWMDGVKHFFGMLLLAVALWTVQPLLAEALHQALLGALLVGTSLALGLLKPWHVVAGPRAWLRKTLAFAALAFGLLQWLGAAAGGTDPLKPLSGVVTTAQAAATTVPAGGKDDKAGALNFQAVHSVAELDAALRSAGRPVMLDFYADWCKSCKEMEHFTFSDPQVRQRLAKALLLKADVTANSAEDRELLKRFKLFGPPGTIFFNAAGEELDGKRVIGFQDAQRFLSSLEAAGI